MSSQLFVFEGPNGCGKTSLSRRFADYLVEAGIAAQWLAFPGREPRTLGYHVYMVHREPAGVGIEAPHPASLQTLHIAAHIDQIETRILPALRQGITVVLDRFWWSTWVYGLAAGVPEESLRRMLHLEECHWGDVLPHAVFLVECDQPFDEPLSGGWTQLKRRYEALATCQQARQSVVRIRNSGTIDEAFASVVQSAQPEVMTER